MSYLKKMNRLLFFLFLSKVNRHKFSFMFDYKHANLEDFYDTCPKEKFDLIIVYYTSYFLSIKQIAEIAEYLKSPVAFYLMDMGSMTGGCHYAWDCKGYVETCTNCQITDNILHRYFIANEWKTRKKFYSSLSPTIISGTTWLLDQAKDASLFNNCNHEFMMIGLDDMLYNPQWRDRIRDKFGFKDSEIIIYFGAQSIDDPRKGFIYLLDALKLLKDRISHNELLSVRLLTIGKNNNALNELSDFNHLHIDFIENEIEYAKMYSAVDILISASIEDSGPMMINESILSGTPVISFEMGVAVDFVFNGETGFRVPLRDFAAMSDAILKFIRMGKEKRLLMRENCRIMGLDKTTNTIQMKKIVEIVDTIQRDFKQ